MREYTTQAMRPDLLRDALPYQVQDLLPVPASQAVLDFYPLAEHDGQVSGLLVAAVTENIEQIIATLSRVKLKAHAVDLAAFGLARVTAPLAVPDETVATVSIGDHTTQVIVSRGGIPQFVRLLPIDVPTAATRRHAPSTSSPLQLPWSTRPRRPPERAALCELLRLRVSMTSPRGCAARSRSLQAARTRRRSRECSSRARASQSKGCCPRSVPRSTRRCSVVTATDVIAVVGPATRGEFGLNLVGTVGIALGEVR